MTQTNRPSGRLAAAVAITALVLLCINPGLTQGEDNKNLLLCSAMCLSPLVMLMREARVFLPRIDIPLVTVCICVIAMPCIFHPASVRWITMLFTCACCVYFMMLARLVRMARFTAHDVTRIITGIIYAFAAVLVLQQFCVLFGLPVPLEAMSYPGLPWKLNSLTAEPSHTAVTLGALMFFYTLTRRTADPHESLRLCFRRQWPVWVCFVWVMFSTVNASAYLLAPLCLIPYIDRRTWPYALLAAATVALIVFLTPVGQFSLIKRLKDTMVATLTLNPEKIIEADGSAAFRIVPTIYGAKSINPTESDFWTGHGTDADQRDIEERPYDRDHKGSAGIFSLLYNYGAICALAFWAAIFTTCVNTRKWITIIPALFALQLSVDFNMQLCWMVMAFALLYNTVSTSRR